MVGDEPSLDGEDTMDDTKELTAPCRTSTKKKKKVTKPSPSARHGLAVATEEPMEDGYSDGDESPRNGSTGSEALVNSQLC